MDELLRTNDPVLISFVSALLSEAGIGFIVADSNMSVLEGSLGVLPRRVLVDAGRFPHASRLLDEAGIGHVVSQPQEVVGDFVGEGHPAALNVGKI